MAANYRGMRSYEQSMKSIPLKSRRLAILAISVLVSVVLVSRFNFIDFMGITGSVPPPGSLRMSSSSLNKVTTSQQQEGETTIADPVSVSDVTTENAPAVEDVSAKDADDEPAPVAQSDAEADHGTSSPEQAALKAAEDAQIGDIPLTGEPGKCLKHVLYDKPVKTGSTAISFAIREFLREKGEKDKACAGEGPLSCVERAKSICNGTVEEKDSFSILGHLRFGGRKLAECLRPRYYVVTSVREPYQRRKSAYLWNRTLNGTHFTIPYTASFKEFMNRMPKCQLYHYYDGRGQHCDVGMLLEDRIQDIVDRVDEVIDLYDEPAGPLHKLISKYIRRENESIKIDEKEYLEDFDRDTLKEEQVLYDRLREKRLQPPNKDRLVC